MIPRRSDPDLEREVRRHLGAVPSYVGYLAWCPWLVRGLLYSHPSAAGLVHLEPSLAEAVSLVVSQDNSCRYCYAAHRATLRLMGFREDQIRRLEEHVVPADFGPADDAALELARRISRSDPLPTQADKDALVAAGFEPMAVQELIVVAALNIWANRCTTIPALPPEGLEGLPDRWYVKLARPLIGRVMLSRWRRGRSVEPLAADPERPFDHVVRALDGLPVARGMARLIDGTWSANEIPRRTKALVFAVVARALGCELSAREAARLAAVEGLDADRLAPILDNLASPDLDELESLVVPFARETVRYQPVQIQRRARAIREKLTEAQFIELAGVMGLANALCRSAILVDGH